MHMSSSHPRTRGSLRTPGISKKDLEFQKLRVDLFSFLALQASTLHIIICTTQLNFPRVPDGSF
jgi:hypothetical protein